MSMDSIPLADLGNAKAFKFEKIGDTVSGRITKITHRQQREFGTNKPKVWDGGEPMMEYVITIMQADNTETAIFARAGNYEVASGEGRSMLMAIAEAARAAGVASLDAGAELAVQHTGLSKPAPGMNPAKLYTAAYRPAPTSTASLDSMFTS